MAIIYSYPTVAPAKTDLILGTDVSANGKPTKNFTVQGIIDLVTIATGDLQTVLDLGEIAIGKDIVLGTRVVPTQTMYAGTFTTGSAIIAGAVGTGFTDFTYNFSWLFNCSSYRWSCIWNCLRNNSTRFCFSYRY